MEETNNMTARSLLKIAEYGGPRCCKRNTFLAIDSVVQYFSWNVDKIDSCAFTQLNNECINIDCPYFLNQT